MNIELDPEAYQAGFQAGEAGKPKCPYPAGSREAWSWWSGYVESDAKRQGCDYSRGAPK